jgi:hypothetical protein
LGGEGFHRKVGKFSIRMRSAPSQKIVLFCSKWRVEMQCGATVSSFIEISPSSLDTLPIPVAVQSQANVSGRFNAGIAGSNPAEGKAVHLSCVV